jgi:hypothetical protein
MMFYGLVILGDRGDGTIITTLHPHDTRACWLQCYECQRYEAHVKNNGHGKEIRLDVEPGVPN